MPHSSSIGREKCAWLITYEREFTDIRRDRDHLRNDAAAAARRLEIALSRHFLIGVNSRLLIPHGIRTNYPETRRKSFRLPRNMFSSTLITVPSTSLLTSPSLRGNVRVNVQLHGNSRVTRHRTMPNFFGIFESSFIKKRTTSFEPDFFPSVSDGKLSQDRATQHYLKNPAIVSIETRSPVLFR